MPCPSCSTEVPQKRADGRCVACGKLLPEDLHGVPDPVPLAPVSSSLMKPGDYIEWEYGLQAGDIVLLLQLHRERFALKRVTPAEAAEIPGVKYIVPAEWSTLDMLDFRFDEWQQHHTSTSRKPWWRFW